MNSTLMLMTLILLVTFAIAGYAAFLRPVGVSAAEIPQMLDVSKVVDTELAKIDTKLRTFQTNLDNRLAVMEDTAVQVTRWEYKTLQIDGRIGGPFGPSSFTDEGTNLGGGVFAWEDGTDAVVKQFNMLGDEGWELVGFTHVAGEITGSFVFKRPKQ